MNPRPFRPFVALAAMAALGAVLLAQGAAADMLPPHVVYGYITGPDGNPASGCQVAITNTRTGDTATPADDWNLTTDGEGRYSADLNEPALFPNGWLDGDGIRISIIGSAGTGQRTAVYDADYSSQQVNVALDPLPEEEPDSSFPAWAYWALGGGAVLLVGFVAYWLLVPPKA